MLDRFNPKNWKPETQDRLRRINGTLAGYLFADAVFSTLLLPDLFEPRVFALELVASGLLYLMSRDIQRTAHEEKPDLALGMAVAMAKNFLATPGHDVASTLIGSGSLVYIFMEIKKRLGLFGTTK